MEFWLWMPQLFACTRARIKTQINRGLSPIILLSPIIPIIRLRTVGRDSFRSRAIELMLSPLTK